MLLKKLSENDKLISLKCLAFILNKKELFAFDQTPMHAYSAVILAEMIRVCTNIKTNVQRKEYLEEVVDAIIDAGIFSKYLEGYAEMQPGGRLQYSILKLLLVGMKI